MVAFVLGVNTRRMESGRKRGRGGAVMRMEGRARRRVRDVKMGIESLRD